MGKVHRVSGLPAVVVGVHVPWHPVGIDRPVGGQRRGQEHRGSEGPAVVAGVGAPDDRRDLRARKVGHVLATPGRTGLPRLLPRHRTAHTRVGELSLDLLDRGLDGRDVSTTCVATGIRERTAREPSGGITEAVGAPVSDDMRTRAARDADDQAEEFGTTLCASVQRCAAVSSGVPLSPEKVHRRGVSSAENGFDGSVRACNAAKVHG